MGREGVSVPGGKRGAIYIAVIANLYTIWDAEWLVIGSSAEATALY